MLEQTGKTREGYRRFEGWFTLGELAKRFNLNKPQIERLAIGLAKKHPEWAREEEIRGDGLRGKLYSTEMAEAMEKVINNPPPDGWHPRAYFGDLFNELAKPLAEKDAHATNYFLIRKTTVNSDRKMAIVYESYSPELIKAVQDEIATRIRVIEAVDVTKPAKLSELAEALGVSEEILRNIVFMIFVLPFRETGGASKDLFNKDKVFSEKQCQRIKEGLIRRFKKDSTPSPKNEGKRAHTSAGYFYRDIASEQRLERSIEEEDIEI